MSSQKILVSLRDGKKLIGVLRSYDQFANLVLQDTIERIYVGIDSEGTAEEESNHSTRSTSDKAKKKTANKKGDMICKYTDVWRGIYLVRGENVVLIGEIVQSLKKRKKRNSWHYSPGLFISSLFFFCWREDRTWTRKTTSSNNSSTIPSKPSPKSNKKKSNRKPTWLRGMRKSSLITAALVKKATRMIVTNLLSPHLIIFQTTKK
ncbi:hypothetical protein VP01_2480g1 [Puccinia sorghi]|uniref:U6 snRNA-associated Sm-like protein LSm1 n=1 Tax=Puccinia sorghi TaxID=27349 RepID=A0A0L6V7R5_9BASI|nr:hypothetical protein VP01_2480g1 [Puccinia sorghi]